MKSSPRSFVFASPFRVVSFGSAALALGAAFAIACSSSDKTPAAPLSGDDDASSVDSGAAASGNDAGNGIGSTEPDSGAGDDGGAGGDDAASTGCPSINGNYSLMIPAAGSNSMCPSDTDTCTFATDSTTCKFTGECASSGQMFNTTIDSAGKISYTQSIDAGSTFGTIMGDCMIQFAADKATLMGSCTFDSFVTCNATGAYLGGSDSGVILDASTD